MIEQGSYLTYLGPPIIGAAIGYLTNRVAIRMLFRPLKKWRVGPLSLPMTPGVIPAKRHELARNIAEMVAEHLLTSEELNKALHKDAFQSHLYKTIRNRLQAIAHQDWGTIYTVLPPSLHATFDEKKQEFSIKISRLVVEHLNNEPFESLLKGFIDDWTRKMLARDIRDFVTDPTLLEAQLAQLVQKGVQAIVTAPQTQSELYSRTKQYLLSFLTQQQPLGDFVPNEIRNYLHSRTDHGADYLLKVCSELLKKPGIQERLSQEAVKAILAYIETLGPMASMIQGFMTVESLEKKISDYLFEHQDDVARMITGDQVKNELSSLLKKKTAELFDTKVTTLMAHIDYEQRDKLTAAVSSQVTQLLTSTGMETLLTELVTARIRAQLSSAELRVGTLASGVVAYPEHKIAQFFHAQVKSMLSSETFYQTLEKLSASMLTAACNKPIGSIAHLFSATTIEAISETGTSKLTGTLARELPSLLPVLDIKKIVSTRIDSFDLLRLERLLLSIMEQQFKYINLFGGLLGFLIGCLNLLFFLK